MKRLTDKQLAEKKSRKAKQSQEKILKKLEEKPVESSSSKSDAVARVAYDKADAALKIASNQSDLVMQMTKAIESLKTDKQIKGYKMTINRNAEGFMQSIDVEIT
jgi:hypothetical protein